MKVILQKEVDKLGSIGDIIKVSEGYARNYLIPSGLALQADEQNVKRLEHQKKVVQSKISAERKEAEKLAQKISAHSCTIAKKVGENEKLFGSVTSADIEENMIKAGFSISRKDIVMPEPIKALGVYTIPVRVFSGIEANLKVWVVQE
jgi:large subunit ribosomal protein L9